MRKELSGKTVIIVEDEPLSVLALTDVLERLGCEVVGHAGTVESALELAGSAAFDIALLDVNLHGKSSYPVAQELAARDVPFLFTTGSGEAGPDWCRHRPRILKPYSGTSLERMMLASLVSDSAPARI
jgi:CheY-like chemotaxis protein